MVRTVGQMNGLRTDLVGAALEQTNEAFTLQEGESFTATYVLSGDDPKVDFSGTLKLEKVYDSDNDTLSFRPWFEPAT